MRRSSGILKTERPPRRCFAAVLSQLSEQYWLRDFFVIQSLSSARFSLTPLSGSLTLTGSRKAPSLRAMWPGF